MLAVVLALREAGALRFKLPQADSAARARIAEGEAAESRRVRAAARADGLTLRALRAMAARQGVPGRSRMSKAQLKAALGLD